VAVDLVDVGSYRFFGDWTVCSRKSAPRRWRGSHRWTATARPCLP